MNIFEEFSQISGLPIDQSKLLIIQIILIPLFALFIRFLPKYLRIFYNISLGCLFLYLQFGTSSFQLDLCFVISFFLTKYLQRKFKWLLLLFVLTHLSLAHIYRYIYTYGVWEIEISVALMMSICKISSFAFCFSDGAESKENLSPDQNLRKIEQMPSFLDYLEYMFFFPTIIIGPTFDFYDFQQFLNRKNLGNPFFQIIRSFFFASIFFFYNFLLGKYVPDNYWISEDFDQQTLMTKYLLILLVIGFFFRAKYFGVWYASEVALAASGLSYSGRDADGHQKWDNVTSLKLLELESANSPRDKINYWNYSVHLWLKRYVYQRISGNENSKKKNQVFAEYMTFLVSALWHGFYFGYYFFFVELAMVGSVAKGIYKNRNLFKWIPDFVKYILGQIVTVFFMSYCSIVFFLLDMGKIYKFYSIVGFGPLALIIAATLFFQFESMFKQKQKIRVKKE